jgi:hypothetical protein
VTYQEALQQEHGVSRVFAGKNYRPFNSNIEHMFPAPKDAKRLAQFIDLYGTYNQDWNKAAFHFQLEEFVTVTVFKPGEEYIATTFDDFIKCNRFHFNIKPLGDE